MEQPLNLYLYNIILSFEGCAIFLAKKNIKPFNAEKDYPKKYNEIMEFFMRYTYLNHALNVVFSNKINKTTFYYDFMIEQNIKTLLQNYDFSWIKDERKLHTATAIIVGFLNITKGEKFYEKYCSRALAPKGHFLFNDSKMKILSKDELSELFVTLIWEEIVKYANMQREALKHLLVSFKYEDLVSIHLKLRHYSYDLFSLITQNCKSYFTSDYDDSVGIKVTSIKTANVKIKEAYLGLRKCIISIFPKQKDVTFPFNSYSVLGNAMFSEPNINFKDCVKLIIKSKDIKAFVTNVKLKGSEFMELSNWSVKFERNIGNIILLFMNNEEYKARILKEFEDSQVSH